jgi:hypothetical protein
MDIMRNNKPVSSICCALARDIAEEEVFRVLDEIRGIHQVILGVQVEVDNMVTESSHISLATRSRVTV